MVRAAQKGEMENPSPEVAEVAATTKRSSVKKFAKTKHKGLPEKKVTKESFNEDAKMAKQSDEKLQAAHKKFSGMDKSPANTFMLKRIQREMNKRKKNVKYSMKEDYVKELEDGLVKMDYPAYDEVDKLMQKIAKDNGIDTTTLHMAFKTKHLMVPDDWAKKKMMEPIMIPKTPEGLNINEDDGNYHMNKIARERGYDLTDPRQRRKANSIARQDAAKRNINNPAGFSKRKKRKKMQVESNDIERIEAAKKSAETVEINQKPTNKFSSGKKVSRETIKRMNKPEGQFNSFEPDMSMVEGSLHKWFKGSKSKDGKGGWVNVVTGGTCASDEPGEGTPKCVSSSKRASMTKAERLSASRRKKKADPNQQSKSGAAKPTYVSTDKPKKKVSEAMMPKKTESDIRRSTERSLYDTSDGESEIAKRTRVARKLALSGNIRDQKKAKEMEADTSRKLVAAQFMWEAKNKIKRDEYGDPIGGPKISKKQKAKNLSSNTPDEQHTTTTSEAYSSKPSNMKKKAKLNAALKRLEDMKVASKMKEEVQIDEGSPAWQRKEGKSESGGLNAKGVASYRAANPGSKLKTAVTTKPSKLKKGSKSAKRRKSFCARMKGMKKRLTSAKTARDPDSRINKSLRKWNCSFEPEHGEVISEGKVAKMIKSLRRKTKVLEKGQKKERDAGAIAAKIMKQKEHNKYVNFLPVDEEKKKCGEGEYYCNDDKKCKPIPKGYKIGYGGYLKPENQDANDESNGKKGGSNGNGNGNGGNGNGHGGNGNGGNGGGNGAG